jgi:dTMP kinase
MAGRFVVLEGGDGSGKSTQAARLAERLRDRGLTVLETFEPGATEAGAVMRELLLHGRATIAPTTETLLMAADRAQHVAEQVAPALARGDWVVCDRYLPSSLVYQGVVRDVGVDVVDMVNRAATRGVEPDLVVVLDVPDDVADARTGDTPDRMEAEGEAFQSAVRAAYRSLAAARGWVVIDGAPAVDTVADAVWARVAELLDEASG